MSDTNPDFQTPVPPPGELLGQKRKEYGWKLSDVARSLKLSTALMESLERDDYGNLPGRTYILGYWRSYANLLEITIDRSIEVHKHHLDNLEADIALEPTHQKLRGSEEKSRRRFALLFALLSVVCLAALWYWQSNRSIPLPAWLDSSQRPVSVAEETESAITPLNSLTRDSAIDAQAPVATAPAADTPEPSFSGAFTAADDEPLEAVDVGALIEPVTDEPLGEEPLSLESGEGEFVSTLPDPDAGTGAGEAVAVAGDTTAGDDGDSFDTETGTGATADSDVGTPVPEAIPEEGSTTPEVEVNDAAATSVGVVTEAAVAVDTTVGVEESAETPTSTEEGTSVASDADAETTTSGDSQTTVPADGAVAGSEATRAQGADAVSFEMAEESWLEVHDRDGNRLIYRVAAAGETVVLEGRPPYTVVVGNIDGVTLTYRGEQVDLVPHFNGRYASFELGAGAGQ